MKSLRRRSGPTTIRRFVLVKLVEASSTREYGSKAMHPSRIRARISKVWTVSRSARKFCCTIHFSGNLNGSTCSTRIFHGPRGIVRQRGYGPILFSRSASAPSNLYGTKVAMRQSPCTGHQPLAQWRLRTRHLLLHERPIVDRRLATTVTKSRVEVWKLRPHANDGQHLNVREKKSETR